MPATQNRRNTEQQGELIPLVEAARRLAVRYGTALNWLLTKRLEGERVHGHWMATSESVERLRRERHESTPAVSA
jgi:hypothetical protein